MVKLKNQISEIPKEELKKIKKIFCAVCRIELKDKAIVIKYPQIKVAVPLCQEHFDELEEEQIDTIARLTQMNGGELYK